MASQTDLITIIHSRFAEVPGFTEADAERLIEEAVLIFGVKNVEALETDEIQRMLAYASSEAAMTIAVDTASFFKFTDGEESVDKSMISENYREIAADYRAQLALLEKQAQRRPTANFTNLSRIDRPPFDRNERRNGRR